MRRLRLLTILTAAVFLAGCAASPSQSTSRPRVGRAHTAAPTPASKPSRSRTGVAPAGSMDALLSRVRVVPSLPYHPGYDRACDPGACVFGPPWTDANDTPTGRNGCDTRQDVLLAQMRHIELRWGSRCRIYQATLTDPYTGRRLTWRHDGYFIEIDHVYPLATAWRAGAWAWPQQRRTDFANDVARELLAVWGPANQAKLDAGPAAWLPRPAYACAYLRKYLSVALHYRLPITSADAAATHAAHCP